MGVKSLPKASIWCPQLMQNSMHGKPTSSIRDYFSVESGMCRVAWSSRQSRRANILASATFLLHKGLTPPSSIHHRNEINLPPFARPMGRQMERAFSISACLTVAPNWPLSAWSSVHCFTLTAWFILDYTRKRTWQAHVSGPFQAMECRLNRPQTEL